MASYILKRKLFTTDILGAENELRNAESILATLPQNSPRYQKLKDNIENRRRSLQTMQQTSQMVPNQVYTTAPATPTPAPKPTTTAPPKPPKGPTGTATAAGNKINWGKVGKGALIGGAVVGATYLAAKQIKKNKENKAQQQQQQKTYSFRKKCLK